MILGIKTQSNQFKIKAFRLYILKRASGVLKMTGSLIFVPKLAYNG